MIKPSIAVFAESPELQFQAKNIAKQLNLPLFNPDTAYNYLFMVTANYLGLKKLNDKSKPLYIDFLSKKMQIRSHQATVRKELLAKALGLKTTVRKRIVDATTGLARDSFIIATLGFEIIALERSAIIYTLIKDGLARATSNSNFHQIISRIHLINTDSIEWLRSFTKNDPLAPDIIYLDPMFPHTKKSALSKQDMRIFHDILGEDIDSENLLKSALGCAAERVVVKRPRTASPIANLKPNFSMEGSSNRFDIYLTR